ncbi:MAG: hypothetical protein RIC55_33545 [Pirellulaceae bacterium]
MEQVRTIAKQAREHWFWIVCASIFLVGLVTWFVVTSGMSDHRSTRVQELTNRDSIVKTVKNAGVTPEGRTQTFHPNDVTHEKMTEQIATLKDSVVKAWKEQHSSQGERVFAWPAALPEDFRNRVAKITSREERDSEGKPMRLSIEEAIPFPLPKDDKSLLDVSSRQIYGSYIHNELPKLAARIQSNWGTPEDRNAVRPVVWWEPTNQQHIANSRFEWSDQDDGAPNTLQVFYAQEDLRVLEALMDIIAETNKGATADFNAAIKRIEFIHLGRDASRAAGSIKKLGVALNTGADGQSLEGAAPSFGGDGGGDDYSGDDPAMDPSGGDPAAGGDFGGGGGGGAPIDPAAALASQDPAHHRYVDLNYQPLPAQTLRDSFNSKDPAIAKLAVAKRLPVRMRVVIDQRRLNDLLAACGNSSLTVEVRQVRLNPQSDSGVNRNQSSSGGSGFGGEGFGGDENFDTFSSGGSRAQAKPQKDKNTQFDVTVELYGIVYIYNPVDTKKFGVPAEASAEGEAAPPPIENAT